MSVKITHTHTHTHKLEWITNQPETSLTNAESKYRHRLLCVAWKSPVTQKEGKCKQVMMHN